MTEYVRIDRAELYRFTRDVFVAIDVPADHAAVIADNLVTGEAHGLSSHGPSRLLRPYVARFREGGTNRNPSIQVVHQDRGCAVIDGDHGPGSVVGKAAMELAMDLAAKHGSGWVGVHNSTHFGPAFVFGKMAFERDMIGFSSTNAVSQVAPWGGTTKALGTNPICVAVPGAETDGITLDMATSVVARGKVQIAILEDKEIPLGWGLTKDSEPTTDPSEVDQMLPVGGYKGYGLALMVEVFCALLSGASISAGIGSLFASPTAHQDMGHFFGAMDISAFGPVDAFRTRVDDLVRYVKRSDLREGYDMVMVPGEPEMRKAAEYARDGIPVAVDVVAEMNEIGAGVGVVPLRQR